MTTLTLPTFHAALYPDHDRWVSLIYRTDDLGVTNLHCDSVTDGSAYERSLLDQVAKAMRLRPAGEWIAGDRGSWGRAYQ